MHAVLGISAFLTTDMTEVILIIGVFSGSSISMPVRQLPQIILLSVLSSEKEFARSSDTGVPIGTSMLCPPEDPPDSETILLIIGILSDIASQQASIVEQLKRTASQVSSMVSPSSISLP